MQKDIFYFDILDDLIVTVDVASITEQWDSSKIRTMTRKLGDTTTYGVYIDTLKNTRFKTLDGLEDFIDDLEQRYEIAKRQFLDWYLINLEAEYESTQTRIRKYYNE